MLEHVEAIFIVIMSCLELFTLTMDQIEKMQEETVELYRPFVAKYQSAKQRLEKA